MGAPLWGTCDSIIAAVAMKKEVIRKIIPEGIEFTSQDLTPEDEHPVLYMFNKQKIRVFFPWLTRNYYEMIPLIPWVHLTKEPGKNYQMAPILYVSSLMVVIGARILWHLNKVWAKMKVNPPMQDFPKTKYVNETVFRKGIEAIQMNAAADGELGKPPAFPNLQKLSPMLLTDALINAPGPVFYTAVYQVTMNEVQGANVKIEVLNIDGWPDGSFSVPSINNAVLGGFFLNFSWNLYWPKKQKNN